MGPDSTLQLRNSYLQSFGVVSVRISRIIFKKLLKSSFPFPIAGLCETGFPSSISTKQQITTNSI